MEMARTKASQEDDLRRRSIPIDDDTWDKTQKAANQVRISASAWVRMAIWEKLRKEQIQGDFVK